MVTKSFRECESEKMRKLMKVQLPHSYKKVGASIFIICILSLFANQLFIRALEWSVYLKYGLLAGMLIYSVSREKIEDELVISLRMQSYTFAFVVVVFLVLAQPVVNYLVDFIVDDNKSNFDDLGDFEILWFLLSIQLFYFEFQKKVHR